MTPDSLADEIAQRVNCYGLVRWAGELAQTLGIAPALLIPVRPVEKHIPELRDMGLELVFGYRGELGGIADPERWLLRQVRFHVQAHAAYGAWRQRLPFSLDARNETPASAEGKLGTDRSGGSPREIAHGDTRITYFLPDGRAVELHFAAGMRGLERVGVSRLGKAMPESDCVQR
jgi:hypothetical protein